MDVLAPTLSCALPAHTNAKRFAPASIPLGGRPAGPTGGARSTFRLFSHGGRILSKARKPHVDPASTRIIGRRTTHGSGLLDRSVFIASDWEREGPTVVGQGRAGGDSLPFRMGGTHPAGRPARPAATKSAYDDDNVGIDRPLSGPNGGSTRVRQRARLTSPYRRITFHC